MKNINYQIEQNRDVPGQILMYLRDDKINRALNELKRVDKSNLAIIQDTIKILEEGIELNTKRFEAQAMADLAAPLKSEPVGRPAMPNSVVNGKVVLPDIKIDVTEKDIMGKGMSDMFRGGML